MTSPAQTDAAGRAPRRRPPRRKLVVWRVVLLWAAAMVPLAFWGLPTSRYDDLLFGGQAAWSPEHYAAAAALRARQERAAGADVDLNPRPDTTAIADLTADEGQRAEILRRYRLYSRQPDEMITLMALQQMRPRAGDFDPQLYQYGGGYIYLIGASIGLASVLNLVELTTNVDFYLEQPEQFARFYLVGRFVSLVFGALTLVAVVRLAHRAGGRLAGWIALLLVASAPVFITGVLEAKPHLPAVCLVLWATLSAQDYRTRGRLRDAVRMGLQAGYAFGLVLTGVVAAALWPLLLLVQRTKLRQMIRHLVIAALLAIAVYVVTNPYVPYNALFRRAALASNVENSIDMYRDRLVRFPEGAARVGVLLVESCGVGVLVAGAIGLIGLTRKRWRATWLAAAAGVATLIICVAIGAGKPAEFARFLLLPAVLLCVAAAWTLAALYRRHVGGGVLAAVLVLATTNAPAYVRSFASDARGVNESRLVAARLLRETATPTDVLGVLQEPAPYAVPPLDFAHAQVRLLPAARPADLREHDLPVWLVFTADGEGRQAGAWWQSYYELVARIPDTRWRSEIAWADKPVFVYRRAAAH
ncbi:MAG: glycosyltransferase family 39 protein [Planctomycetes bacterium]|nr:glycosyltransferase family 39 protein [Planctomycetota bacterium]